MPKVIVTPAKGLHQVSASGNDAGTISGNLRRVITLEDADKVLTVADSGAIIKCVALTGNKTVTLPARAGVHFEVHSTDIGSHNLNFEAGSLGMVGTVVDAAAEATNATTTNSIFRVNDNGGVGDKFTLVCDGTNYVVNGVVADATKYTFHA